MSTPPARRLRTRNEKQESKFEKLRRLRETGKSALDLMKDSDDEDELYTKVDEDEYQRILQTHGADDFVVDDDGSGYVETGTDDIGDTTPRKQSKLKTTKKPIPSKPSAKPDSSKLNAMFRHAQLKSRNASKPKPSAAGDDDEFFSNLLSGLDADTAPRTPQKAAKRKPTTPVSVGGRKMLGSWTQGRQIGIMDISDQVDPFGPPPTKKQKPDESAVVNADNDEDDVFAIKQEKDVLAEEMPAVVVTKDDEMDVDIDFADLGEDIMDAIDEKPAQPPAEPLYAEDATDKGTNWMDVQTGVGTSQPTTLSQTEAPSLATGDLCMYWLDAFEKNGNIYLFGKTPANGSYQSCCVQVSGVERNVFVLPSIDPTTGERFNALDVHKEFEKLALPIIRRFDCKPVVRKYAFEIAGVPSEAEYLKVVYSFTQPALPADMKGTTFERTFGTSYSALELFLLKRRIMGPCWLTLHNATAVDTHDRLSWCRTEFSIADPKLVKIMDDSAIEQKSLPREPPLTTMTLSLKTVMNHKAKENEVVALSMLVHRNMKLDDPKPASQRPADQYTAVRQLTGIPLPAEFSRQRGLAVEVCKTETALLNYFIALLHRTDPDILISHNFYGFDLDVLLHRMRALRTDGWSKLGRLRRVQWPKMSSGGAGYAERQIVAGRVVCDTYMASKDLIRAKSYSMSSLAAQELQIKREEIPFERIPEYFATSQKLVHFLRHTAFDAFLAASLMIHLQALPLTKQLTTLAGNLWSRTLMGARAERNEFLLLHEFYRNKFIRPDKVFGKQAAVAQQQPANEDEDEQPEVQTGRRKPAYMGGLVLEPKRGFYDRYVLLLDFNSLYPSIIQEFNICFTTVRRSTDNPDLPSPDTPAGILPRLLKALVDRRRQVKQLLKAPNLSHEESGQLDVRQRALKLTANSMYGCLGFTFSRFYAKPLAMLITSRGRDILQATRDLALSDGLEVIYGDTDSIMIATQTDDLADVYTLGAQFKRRVNDRYHLLELDIDGVFKRLLLLKKKKYAALLISQTGQTKLETKGLDLVRRDWCELSHDVSDFVLKHMFADNTDESAVVALIHDHLQRVGDAVRAKQVPLDKYVIHKGLTKAPEAYADKNSQPHVQVALRMRASGLPVRQGDTVPYVVCDPACVPGSSYAERARHPDEIKDSSGQLYPDTDWYLNQQVLPPCARLLDPLDATDMPTLAQALGLDPSKYQSAMIRSSGANSQPADALHTLDSQISDHERFRLAHPFTAICPQCKSQYEVAGIVRAQPNNKLVCGLTCTNCNALSPPALLATQMALLIRRHIRKYYCFEMACDEPACGLRSRTVSVAGSRCLRPHCSGRLNEVYTDKMLYNQILFFSALLNTERSAARLGVPASDVRIIRDAHMEHISKLATVVDSYMSVSARRFVDMSTLFSFCKI